MQESVIVAGDFNGDGRAEVLTAADFLDAQYLRGAAAGDLDGDGRLDVVTRQDMLLVFHRNRGDGRFEDGVVLHRTSEPFLIGDFLTGGGEEIFTREAIITFDGRKVTPELARPYFRIVSAGDFDDDGHLDLAGTDFKDDLIILRGEGNGRFPTVTQTRSGGTVWDVEVADFDGDGRDDAAVSNHADDTVSIFLDAMHGAPFVFAVSDAPAGMLAADFDGDGDPDLAVDTIANSLDGRAAPQLTIYRNDGRGGFTFADRLPAASPLFAEDLNGDGVLDLVVASTYQTGGVIHGNGDGTFDTPGIYPSFGEYPQLRETADLDGDGIDELLLTTVRDDREIRVGRFGKDAEVLPRLPSRVLDVAAGDLLGDAQLEILVSLETHMVVFQRASGFWSEAATFAFDRAWQLVVRDFTGDAKNELAFLQSSEGRTQLRVVTRDGLTLEELPVTPGMFTTLLPLDANGDGRLDLLVASSGTWSTLPHDYGPQANGYVAIRFNEGGARFSDEVRVMRDLPLNVPVAGDFNGDGFDDIAVGTWPGYSTPRLLRAMSNGDRTYDAPEQLDLAGLPVSWIELAADDLDRDGDDDLVALLSHRELMVFDGTTARGPYVAGSAAGLTIARVRDRARPSIVVPVTRSGEMTIVDPQCAPRRRRAV